MDPELGLSVVCKEILGAEYVPVGKLHNRNVVT